MTRRLILVRHARAASPGVPDHLRPLTAEGREQARAVGARLIDVSSGLPLLCSPALRCVETAQVLAESLGRPEPPAERDELREDAIGAELLGLARGLAGGGILVGHQPGLAALACTLLGTGSLPFPFAVATAVVLDAEPGRGFTLVRIEVAP